LVSAISSAANLNFGSTAAGGSQIILLVATGAVDGDAVSLGVPNLVATQGGVYSAWVSGPDSVAVKFSNTTAAAIDPDDATFKVKILK
jgi:hypothetical protein